jgi:hypothetical protein
MLRLPALALSSLVLVPAIAITATRRLEAQEDAPTPSASTKLAASQLADCALLLSLQEGEGKREWPYEGVYRTNEGNRRRVIPIGYRVGGTSIACSALMSVVGYPEDTDRTEAVARGLDFVLEALDLDLMQPTTEDIYDVRGWGHIYALSFLTELAERGLVPGDREVDVRKAVKWLVAALEASDIEPGGGWNYAGQRNASPFMTGPGIQALLAARKQGVGVSKKTVELAFRALTRARTASGGITYTIPGRPVRQIDEEKLHFMDKLPGSIGRMSIVEATLAAADRGDQARLKHAVDSFFEHWQELEVRRQKNGTHIPPYGVAPYYFMYAHHAAAQAIAALDDEDARDAATEKLCATLLKVREKNGGWNDRVFERSLNYGTAMALLAQAELGLTAPVAAEATAKQPAKGEDRSGR